MRHSLSVLAGFCLLAGAVLAVVPGSFAAAPIATNFSYGIVVDEGPPASVGRFTYEARLVHDGDLPVASVTATLQVRPYGATQFSPAGSVTTTGDGEAVVSTVLRSSSEIRWAFAGTAAYAATLSPSFRQMVAPKVAAHAKDTTLKGRQKVVVIGRTAPAKPGTTVSLWRGDKPAFAPDLQMTRIGVSTIGRDGTFALTARFAHPGVKRLYVKVNGGRGTAVGFSNYVRIRVFR